MVALLVLIPDWLSGLGGAITTAVLPGLATIVATFLILLLKRLAKKYGLEVSEKQEDRLKQIIIDAIHRTEELSRRNALSSSEKAEITVSEALHTATVDPSVPTPPRQEVEKLKDTMLSQLRASGQIPQRDLTRG